MDRRLYSYIATFYILFASILCNDADQAFFWCYFGKICIKSSIKILKLLDDFSGQHLPKSIKKSTKLDVFRAKRCRFNALFS